jgi:hypothetical protein
VNKMLLKEENNAKELEGKVSELSNKKFEL